MKKPSVYDEHQWAQEVLPFLANGTLNSEDEVRLKRHLADCAECSMMLSADRQLRSDIDRTVPPVISPHASLAKLNARIDDRVRRQERSNYLKTRWQAWFSRPFAYMPPFYRATLIAQSLAIVGLTAGVIFVQKPAPADGDFRTLSSAKAQVEPEIRIKAVFSASTSVAALTDLLGGVGVHIVGGPSRAGLFELAFDQPPSTAAAFDNALTELRASPLVEFANVDPNGARP